MLPNRTLEGRARTLSRELRCMVCQNQSIDDSDAPLARDLRILVRERLKAGDSDKQVLDFLVARYGEFVLLKPRFSLRTAVLWLGPPVLLLGGGFALFFFARRKGASAPADSGEGRELTASEEARLANLLDGSERPHE
jgi:cytochrome c-type biogenesis protein CcmH